MPAQSNWTGSASGAASSRWGRLDNWSNFLPPVTPLQDAVFGDISGNTTVRVVGLTGGALLAAPRNLRFTNDVRNYTLAVPSGSGLRPQSITLNGSGDVTFNGGGLIRGQLLTLGALTVNGTGDSKLTLATKISDAAFDLPTRLIFDREAGETILSGSNDHSGRTTLRRGTLVLANDEALGSGPLRIEGGTLSNDGFERLVQVDVELRENFTVRDSGDGLFFTQDFELVSGDLEISLDGEGGLVCFEGVVMGDADSLTLSLADGVESFSVSFCGPDSNTFGGELRIGSGVTVSLEKDPDQIAVAGDLDVQEGGAVLVLGGLDQIAETSSVRVDGELGFLNTWGSSTASWNELTGSGSIENVGSAATLRLAGGSFAGRFSDSGPLGALGLEKWSDATLTLSGASEISGTVRVLEGTLQTTNRDALGGGASIRLEGGVLRPEGGLDVRSLSWQNGSISLGLGTSADWISLEDDLVLGTDGGGFEFASGAGFLPNTAYTILTAANMVDSFLSQFSGNALLGIAPTFRVVGDALIVEFLGAVSGPILQNSAPFYTPLNADFVVSGPVRTGGPTENNSVSSLTFRPGGILRVFNTLLVQRGIFDVAAGRGGLVGGKIAVPGEFTKTGAGELDVTSDVFVGGSTSLKQGSTFLNGLFQSQGGVTVFDQALLGGIGQIIGNLINRGIVAPGNSPGTLQIAGDFTQLAGGTFQLEIADTSTFDRLLVSGTASLAGTLDVVNLGADLAYGQAYPFLQAGSITGTFDTISMPNPSLYRGRFLAEDGTGTLLIAPASYTLVAQNSNQRNVAAALDGFIPATAGDRLTVSTALDRLTAEQYPAAFEQIMPGLHAVVSDLLIGQAFAQTQMLNQRLSSVRLGAEGFQAFGLPTEPLRHDRDGKSVADPKSAKSVIETISRPRWSTWAMGNGMFAKITSVNQLPNGRIDSGGFVGGADYRWSDHFVTGLYAGYQGTYGDFGSAGDLRMNGVLFGGYASFQSGGFYADAIVGGGYSNAKIRRSIEFSTIDRTARSQQDAGQFNSSINLGYDWTVSGFTFGPIAGVQYTYAGVAPFTETGAESLNLAVGQQNANSIRSTLGGRIAYTWTPSPKFALIPEVRMLWQHEFLNSSQLLSSSLDGGAGRSFDYRAPAPGQDSVFAGAGVTAQIGESWNASVFYNVDFGRRDYLSHMISAGLAWKF